MEKSLLKLTLILVIVLIGHKVVNYIYDEGYREGFSKAFDVNSKCEELVNENRDKVDEYPVPQCDEFGGGCPKYEHFDLDGDGRRESVVIEPIGMNQPVSRVFIVDDGKVTFLSEHKMNVGVRPIKLEEENETNQSGFIIYYSKTTSLSLSNDVMWDYYRYVDGEYILEKTTKANFVVDQYVQ